MLLVAVNVLTGTGLAHRSIHCLGFVQQPNACHVSTSVTLMALHQDHHRLARRFSIWFADAVHTVVLGPEVEPWHNVPESSAFERQDQRQVAVKKWFETALLGRAVSGLKSFAKAFLSTSGLFKLLSGEEGLDHIPS